MSTKEKELKNEAHECEDDNCNCDTITLELEDGTSEEFIILDTYEHKKKSYVALAPVVGDEYFIYGFKEDGDSVEFFSIEDDKEFETISKVFEKRFAEEETV